MLSYNARGNTIKKLIGIRLDEKVIKKLDIAVKKSKTTRQAMLSTLISRATLDPKFKLKLN